MSECETDEVQNKRCFSQYLFLSQVDQCNSLEVRYQGGAWSHLHRARTAEFFEYNLKLWEMGVQEVIQELRLSYVHVGGAHEKRLGTTEFLTNQSEHYTSQNTIALFTWD